MHPLHQKFAIKYAFERIPSSKVRTLQRNLSVLNANNHKFDSYVKHLGPFKIGLSTKTTPPQ